MVLGGSTGYHTITLKRPIQQLYSLEVRESGTGRSAPIIRLQTSQHSPSLVMPGNQESSTEMDRLESLVHGEAVPEMPAVLNQDLTIQPATLRDNPVGECRRTRRRAHL